MKIHLWNAFASNNSGSYTIVGFFQDPVVAGDVVRVLQEVAEAHASWRDRVGGGGTDSEASPLRRFAARENLTWEEGRGASDDWPEYGDSNVPEVWSTGHQVFIHVDYTVTMPPTFGEYLYRRGGRVQTEIDHAHAPLAIRFELWWPWQGRDEDEVARQREQVIEALTAAEGPLTTLEHSRFACRYRVGSRAMEPDLVVGCVFSDVAQGVRSVAEVSRRHGARFNIQVEEIRSNDPFADLVSPPDEEVN